MRTLEYSGCVLRIVCLLACFKVKILLDCFMLRGPSNGCEGSILFQQLLEPELYKSASGKPHLPLS